MIARCSVLAITNEVIYKIRNLTSEATVHAHYTNIGCLYVTPTYTASYVLMSTFISYIQKHRQTDTYNWYF